MNKKMSSKFIVLLAVVGLMVGCSKKLMPPEVDETASETGSGASALSESSAGGGPGGSGGESGTIGSQGEREFGFIEEGSVGQNESFPNDMGSLESSSGNAGGGAGSPGDLGLGGGSGMDSGGTADFGNLPGNGSDSSFESGPWAGGSSGSGSFGSSGGSGSGSMGSGGSGSGGMGSGGMGEGMKEARLLPFQSSSELSDVHFYFDRHDLDDSSKKILQRNAEWMKQHPNVKVEIQGHSDERGTNNYNLGLGERRANSTKKYLTALGVDTSRLYVISYGEEKPFCMASGENCWWRNRRAHFLVSK